MPTTRFNKDDLRFLTARGSKLENVEAQLRHYVHPPSPAQVVRACVRGDGIVVVDPDEAERLSAEWAERAPGLDLAKFVPASGAASRMFRALLAELAAGVETRDQLVERSEAGNADAADCLAVVDGVESLALRDDLERVLGGPAAEAPAAAILDGILSDAGLGYANLPKGLLAFHREDGEVRTPVHEHLFEACAYASGRGGKANLHFTVSPEHRSRFTGLVERIAPSFEKRFGVGLEIAFSEQHPSTDSLAVTPGGEPFRGDDGALLFRPAGHGALIENLAEIDADVVFVKNIDNVLPPSRAAVAMQWKKVLAALAVRIRDEVFAALAALRAERAGAVEQACTLLQARFGQAAPVGSDPRAWAEAALDRPLRVCGMVRNEGEPGGGPFWVLPRDGGSPSVQIVESSEIDLEDPGQRRILSEATHFNPVDLVCSFRSPEGAPYALARFVDDEAVFIADKSHSGRPLRSLELPGLWNGAMASWNSVFVEVPAATFNPVKTLGDLLRPAHRGRA